MRAQRLLTNSTSPLLRSSRTSSHTLVSSRFPRPLAHSKPTTRLQLRPLSTTPACAAEGSPNPQHDAQEDRKKINTDSNEYTKSGTDDTAAAQEEAAFDPNISDPQKAKKKAGEGNKVNPLDASPANMEISQGTSEDASGAGEKKKTDRESK